MTIEEVREYYKLFKCEVLTTSDANKSEIQDFSSKIRKNNLEGYLKDHAWEHDQEGVTRVYLVRDPVGKIVLFFSLKCGAVFTTYQLDDDFRKLNDAEKAYVKELVGAHSNKDSDLLETTFEIGKSLFPDKYDLLQKIAWHRYKSKKESHEVNDFHNVMKVEECYAAVELQHFCRCDDYVPEIETGFPLGFGLFWEKIVPIIEEITEKVGCEYFYLFAADRSDNPEDRKLISYYKESLFFYDLDDEGVIVLKPGYDENCVGLLQKAHYLSNARDAAWESFSDHAVESQIPIT